MGSVLVIICAAVFSEVIDGYLLTAPRDTIALLGDRVQLDCITNSSRPVNWNFMRYGSGKDEWISQGNETIRGTPESIKILSQDVGQFALVIDPVLMSFTGRYECNDGDEVQQVPVNVTVLDRTPSCEERNVSPSIKTVLCRFSYNGDQKPELEWIPMENSSWNASCDDSSSVGSLRIKQNKNTVGSWHCAPSPTSNTPSSLGDYSNMPNKPSTPETASIPYTAIYLLTGIGVTSTAIVLLAFILHKKYGICSKNRIALDVLCDTAMDHPVQTQTETFGEAFGSVGVYSLAGKIDGQENDPVYAQVQKKNGSGNASIYAQVQKKRTALQKILFNGHDNMIFENTIYESTTTGEARTVSGVSTNNVATDDIIYADLGQFPRGTNSRTQGAPVISREGFNTSIYASINHDLRACPPPPQ